MNNDENKKALRAMVEKSREWLLERAEALAERGVEVAPMVEEMEVCLAALDGEVAEGFVVREFIDRMGEFVRETEEVLHLQQQADLVAASAGLHDLLGKAVGISKSLQQRGDAESERTGSDIAELTGAVVQRLAEGESPAEALQDLSLRLGEATAEMSRRSIYRCALLCEWWGTRPPEWWAEKEATDAAGCAEVRGKLARWRGGEREEFLAELPLADRRRIEALTREDLENPETWKI